MNIEKLSKKVLKYIIRKLKEEFDSASYSDPSDVYEYSNVKDEIDSLVNPLGIDIDDHYQYGFFWLLYLYNKDKDESENLIIPVKKRLSFDVNLDVRKYATETYGHKTFTYSDDEGFNKSMIHSDDDFNYYDGEYIDEDTYDSESGDWEVVSVNTYPLNESTRNRKVLTEEKKRKLQILLKQREYIENEILKLTT